jgi:hypothetical protein
VVDAKKIKKISLAIFFSLAFIGSVKGDEPLLLFEKSNTTITTIPGGSVNKNVVVNTVGGNETTAFSVFFFGDIAIWAKLDNNLFIIAPGEYRNISFKISVPEQTTEGIYNGSIRASTSKGQFIVMNLSLNVTQGVGRIIAESFFEGEIPQEYDVFIIDSFGRVVNSGVMKSGYWLSDYLPYGTYTLLTRSETYVNINMSFNLVRSERRVFLAVSERQGPFIVVEPQHSYIETCPDVSDFSTIRIKNEGFEMQTVNISPSNSIISFDKYSLQIDPGDYKDVRFNTQQLSPGSYESEIHIHHLSFDDTVKVFVEVYPRGSCEGYLSSMTVEYSNMTVIPIGLNHFFVVEITPKYSASILKLEELSTDFPVSFTPKYYSDIPASLKVPFLVKVYSDMYTDGFVVLKARSDVGEESLVIKAETNDLNEEVLNQESSDLRKMLFDFEYYLLNEKEVDQQEVLDITAMSLQLDTLSLQDVFSAKEKIDSVLNESKEFFVIYTPPKPSNDYLLILILALLFVGIIFVLVLRKKMSFRGYLKRLRQEKSKTI